MFISLILILMRSFLVMICAESFTEQQMENQKKNNYAIISPTVNNNTREATENVTSTSRSYWRETNEDQVAKAAKKIEHKTSTPQSIKATTTTTTTSTEINPYYDYKQHLPFDLNKNLKYIIEPLSYYKPGHVSDALNKDGSSKHYIKTHTIRNGGVKIKIPENIYSNNTRLKSIETAGRLKNNNLLLNHLSSYGKINSSENATKRDLLTNESNDPPLSYIPVFSYSNHIYHQVNDAKTQIQPIEQGRSSLDYIDFLQPQQQQQQRRRRPRRAFYDYYPSNYDNSKNMNDNVDDIDDEDNEDDDLEEAQQMRYWSDFFINYKSPHHINFGHIERRPRLFERRFQTIKDGNRYKGEIIWSDDKGAYAEHYWDLAVGKL